MKGRAPTARRVAHDVLVRVETTDAFADVLLEHRLAEPGLPLRERGLATQLVFGTLAWQGWLDHRLSAALDRALETLDPPVRAALRLGAYQLLKLTRIPPHAAINETVSLASHRGARGLVNAVLRRLTRSPEGAPGPTSTDPIEAIALETSHPEWIARLIETAVAPADLRSMLLANNEPGPTTLRVHATRADPIAVARRLEQDGITTRPGHWSPAALVVTEGGARLRGHACLRDGSATVQSEASQLVTNLLAPRLGERILDLCAAPGGKAGAIGEHVGAHGLVVAIDPTPAGVRRIAATAERLRVPSLRSVAADGRRPPLRILFDAVLVDAPCSGFGTLRRHPEIRWRRRPEDLTRLAELQTELLDSAANLVRPGGRLVYAVCTLSHAETWGVVTPWLERQSGFAVEPAATFLGPGADDVTHAHALRTLPGPHGLDGFFAVRLTKTG